MASRDLTEAVRTMHHEFLLEMAHNQDSGAIPESNPVHVRMHGSKRMFRTLKVM